MSRISDLASALAGKFGLSPQEAEAFITAMFDVVSAQLQSGDKAVKVKKLGTFKVTSVSSRESINVNTGERILIEGRNKLSFTPDAVLRDRVNKPFSQFETVPLNDGVDFGDVEQGADDDNGKDPSEEPEQPERPVEQPQKAAMQPQNVGQEQEESGMETAKEETKNKPDMNEEQHVKSAEEMVTEARNREIHRRHSVERKYKKKVRARDIVIVALLAVIIAMAAAGFHYFRQYDSIMKEKDSRILELEITMDNIGAAEAGKNTVASPAPPERKTQAAAAKAKPKAAESQEEKSYNKDPRVRTGAYIITGIERTVTVRKGQTLQSISRAILGKGMECYVEAVNEKREYKEGEKVNIPALKHKKIKSKK